MNRTGGGVSDVSGGNAGCYDWMSSEEGKTSETGRSAELAFVQRDWSWARQAGLETSMH